MNTQPTPETESWCGWGIGGLQVVPASFARKLERERDEAREKIELSRKWSAAIADIADDLRSELAAVTKQRDAVTLRLGNTQERMFNAERQRDRLAEALRECLERLEHHTEFGALVQADMSAMHSSREALQSLNIKP